MTGAPAVRKASLWLSTNLGGALPSSFSPFTSSPDIGLFYFYPSFHYQPTDLLPIPLKRRDARFMQRILRKRLRTFQNFHFLPSISHPPTAFQSEFHQPVAGPSTIRAASNTSYSHSHGQPAASTEPSPAFLPREALHIRGPRRPHRTPRHGKAVAQDEQPPQPLDILSSNPQPGLLATATGLPHFQTTHKYHNAVEMLLQRLDADDLCQTTKPRRLRWRLYALFRILTRGIKAGHIAKSSIIIRVRLSLHRVSVAHMRARDILHSEEIIDRAKAYESEDQRLIVTTRAYNPLLRLYAMSARLRDATHLVETMEDRGAKLDSHSYGSLLSLYANLKDPKNAQLVFNEMQKHVKVVPQLAYTSLMNAYVEAGFWDEAVAIFDELDAHPTGDPLKPDTHTCTTLLKCYVLMGAPLEATATLFQRMQERGIRLNERGHTLLLQAACEAGSFEIAESIFANWDDSQDRNSIDVFVFTVMIRGLLRVGKKEAANEYYQEMVKRGIQPTSVTWSVLLQAYAGDTDPNTRRVLNDLLAEYANKNPATRQQWGGDGEHNVKDQGVFRGTAYANVYGPVIAAYARLVQPNGNESVSDETQSPNSVTSVQKMEAIDLFKEYLSKPGAKPSISMYTALLDMYRKAGDMQGVHDIWSYIINLAIDKVKSLNRPAFREDSAGHELSDPFQVPRSHRNLLCLPLSIYIEAVSVRHMHQSVADTWTHVQQLGFGFDAGNWNHLIVALLRAGEADRAFWTAEELLKMADQLESRGRQTDERDPTPTEPAILSQEITDSPIRPPNRGYQYHNKNAEKRYTYRSRRPARFVPPTTSTESYKSLASADSSDLTPDLIKDSFESGIDSEGKGQHSSILESSTPPELEVRSRRHLTASYSLIRRHHDMHQWHLFSDTIRRLEHELWQLKATDSPAASPGHEGHNLLEHLEASYTRTSNAIALYRESMRLESLRSITYTRKR